jgi:hypothetical protein
MVDNSYSTGARKKSTISTRRNYLPSSIIQETPKIDTDFNFGET